MTGYVDLFLCPLLLSPASNLTVTRTTQALLVLNTDTILTLYIMYSFYIFSLVHEPAKA